MTATAPAVTLVPIQPVFTDAERLASPGSWPDTAA
jgi:hypothetical protein